MDQESAFDTTEVLSTSEASLKLDTSSSTLDSPSSIFPINFLPEEVIIEILKYLSFKDICNTALVSRYLSNIINTNFLMFSPKTLRICLNTWNKDRPWIGLRRYQNFTVDSTSIEKFKLALEPNCDLIQSLSLSFHYSPFGDIVEIRKILVKCPNVVELILHLASINDYDGPLEPLPRMKKLHKLDFFGYSKYFALFMNCDVQILKYRFFDIYDNMKMIKKHLRSTQTIKELKLFGYNEPYSVSCTIFDDDEISNVNFKLFKLKISRHPKHFLSTDYFRMFMRNFSACLVHVCISHTEIDIDYLRDLKALKSLEIHTSLVMASSMNYTIENVIVNRSQFTFLDKIANLKRLRLVSSTTYMRELNFRNLTTLQVLELSAFHIPRLSIPSVKKLTIMNASSFDIESFPIFENNIIDITFNNCDNYGVYFDCLNQPDTRLQNLCILNSKIQVSFLRTIRRNSAKIKNLVMKGCRKHWMCYNDDLIRRHDREFFEVLAMFRSV